MTGHIKPGTAWDEVYAAAQRPLPKAFEADRIRNLIDGDWVLTGEPASMSNARGRPAPFPDPPRITHDEALAAVSAAARAHREWQRPRPGRSQGTSQPGTGWDAEQAGPARSASDVGDRRNHGVWPAPTWTADIDGVQWYLENIENQFDGRTPLPGPMSNIASWNYPISVQVHAELVQTARRQRGRRENPIARRVPRSHPRPHLHVAGGLPVTLVSGSGAQLSDALIQSPEIGGLAFVGGRANGRRAAAALVDTGKRHLLEQEGLNSWGSGTSSDWGAWPATSRRDSSTRNSAAPPTRATSSSENSSRSSWTPTCRCVHPCGSATPAGPVDG